MKEYKLLFIDDNKYELEGFQYYFSDYNLTMFSDPEIALNAIKNDHFDIIITDILMDKINGLELFLLLKESVNNSAYTIAYTGLHSRELFQTITEIGFDEIIEKPVNFELLDLKLQALIKKIGEMPERKNKVFTEDKINYDFSLKGSLLGLTYKEYEILKMLHNKSGEILTHKEIYSELYGKEERSDNIIKCHIKNLRNKITRVDPQTEYIKTVSTKGYILH
jgi:DNA-binding response OmpR family regulator